MSLQQHIEELRQMAEGMLEAIRQMEVEEIMEPPTHDGTSIQEDYE